MRVIVRRSTGCVTNTGEHQIEFDQALDINEEQELACIICGDILWEPGMDHALLDDLLYQILEGA
jgi:hypothetical protein